MASFVREVSVSCPPDRVFGVLCDLDRLPEFSHMTVAIRKGPGRAIATGDRFEQVVKVLGVEFDSEWEVTSVVPGSLIRVEGRSHSNGKASMTQRITPDGDGSTVTFEVDYDPPFGILGDLADKLILERRSEEDAEKILAALKVLCEAVPTA